MSNNTHYQSPYKIRARKQLPYDREKGCKDLPETGDETVNEEMRNNYDNLHTKIPQGTSKSLHKNALPMLETWLSLMSTLEEVQKPYNPLEVMIDVNFGRSLEASRINGHI
jgi:hypothetical protein